jgi:hypothetical protein
MVDHALEGGIVIGIAGDAQVGQRILDLGTLEKAQAAVDTVGNAVLDQALLEDA